MFQRLQSARPRVLQRIGLFLALSSVLDVTDACRKTGGAATGSATGSGDNPKIIYGQVQASTNHTPLYVAIDKGFFKKVGLDVSIQTMNGGTPATMAAMNSGAINVMGAGAAEFVEYAGKKVIDGKMFGEVADQAYDIVVAKDIKNIQQLKGQSIGISGLNGGDNVYFDAVFEKFGVSPKDITFVTMGAPTNRMTALANGAVKAIAIPNDRRAATSAVGDVILKSEDSPIRIPGGMYLANNDLLMNHKPLLKKFLAAMGDATAWIRVNKEAAAAVCVQAVQTTPADCNAAIEFNLQLATTNPYHWSPTGAMNADGIRQAISIVVKQEPELQGLAFDAVADLSIAEASPRAKN